MNTLAFLPLLAFSPHAPRALAGGLPVIVPLALGNFVGDPTQVPVAYEVRDPGTLTVVASGTAYPDASGTLTLAVAAGTWDLALKPSHWLRRTVRGVAVAVGAPPLSPVAFVNGDVNGDDYVTAADRARVTAALGTALGDPGYDPAADVTGDGFVTAADRAVVTAGLGLQGDVAGTAADYRLAVGGYPKTGGDVGNTGLGGGGGATGTIGWTTQVGTAIVGAIVVDGNGTVFTGSGGTVSAVSASGALLWQATVAGTVNGLLLTRGGEVLVSAAKLTSLAGGGTVEWTFPDDFGVTFGSGEACSATNVLSDGTIVQTTPYRVYAINPVTQAVRWQWAPEYSFGGAAVESDDTVVLWDGTHIWGLVGATGAQAFTHTTGIGVGTLPTPSASTYGQVTDPIIWSLGIPAPPCVRGTTVTYPEQVFTGTARVAREMDPLHIGHYYYYDEVSGTDTTYLQVLSGGSVTSIKLATASATAINQVPRSPQPTRLAEDASARFAVAWSGKTTSTQGWSLAETGSAGASIGSDGTVYLATTDTSGASGLVKAVDPTSGAVRWTATLPAQGTGVRPAIGPDGSLYVGTTDGRVVQIR